VRSFFKRAADMMGLSFDKITIISDDLKGDLLPAKELGMKTFLVLSGKIKNENEITQKPDKIFKNINEILQTEKEWIN
jgi:NagD protein